MALHASAATADGGGDDVVSIDNGLVRGESAVGGRHFLGIPYAAPPVGNLRWQPPTAAGRWRGVLDATEFAPHCAQIATPFGLASTSEDCLYLNVFTPFKHGDEDGDCDEGKGQGHDDDRGRGHKKDLPIMV